MNQVCLFSFLAVTTVTFCWTNARGQDNKRNTYINTELGFQIGYFSPDDFDDRKELSDSPSHWRDTTLLGGLFSMKLPIGFYVKHEALRDFFLGYSSRDTCYHMPLIDSALVIWNPAAEQSERPEALLIYFTAAAFGTIAEVHDFVLVDSLLFEVRGDDSSAIAWATQHDSWASLGRHRMPEQATVLNGATWHGLRGSNSTGYYNEHGYVGLQRCSSVFLVRKISDACHLVCSYSDTQMEKNRLGEVDFYNIVSTIRIRSGH